MAPPPPTHSFSLHSVDLADTPDRSAPVDSKRGDSGGISPWSLRSVDWRAVAAAPAWPLLAAALLATVIPLLVLNAGHVTPRSRPATPGDASISLPYRPNSVPAWAAVVGPLIVFAVTAAWVEAGVKRAVHGGATAALGGAAAAAADLAGATLVTVLATEATKLAVGYLRPYFFAACAPPPAGSPPDTPCVPTGVVSNTDDARVSFPSGHSSSSAVIAAFTALYALHTTCVTPVPAWVVDRAGGGRRGPTWRAVKAAAAADALSSVGLVWALLTLLLPLCIGASRIIDNRHHPADVVAGWVLGGTVAALCYARSAAATAARDARRRQHGDRGAVRLEGVSEDV